MDRKREKINVYICSNVGIDYFFFLEKIIAASGFNVIPIYLISEKKYRKLAQSNGFKKIWLRIEMYIMYPSLLFFKALFSKRGSVFVVTSNTFYAPLLTKSAVYFRNIKVVHLLYDLFPDALEIAGTIQTDKTISRLIGMLSTKQNQLMCDGTVYLGDFLRKHANLRWGVPKLEATIDISTDLELYNLPFVSLPPGEKIIIHYGGQLGHMHDAISIVECIKEVLSSELSNFIEFNFYVSGAKAEFLENCLKGYKVNIKSAVPSSKWREDISGFHIGLVSLSPGGASVCLPSKTYAMMAGGMAIIGICPLWSDLASLILQSDAGWIVNNSKYETITQLQGTDYLNKINEKKKSETIKSQFKDILLSIINNKTLIKEKRENAYFGVRKNFNVEILSKKWERFIDVVRDGKN